MFSVFVPARRCPTTSARLPFLTLVMKAPSLPASVIFPPTTYKEDEETTMMNGICFCFYCIFFKNVCMKYMHSISFFMYSM